MTDERLVYIATVGILKTVKDQTLTWDELAKHPAGSVTDPISYGLYCQRIGEPKDVKGKRAGRLPDVLYLLHTSGEGSSQPVAEQLRTKWQQLIPSIETLPVKLFDSDSVAKTIGGVIEDESEKFPCLRIVINNTSGTNPMQSGAFIKAVDAMSAGMPVELVYVQEFGQERVAERGGFKDMVLKSVDPLGIYHARLMEQGLTAFKVFDYQRAQAFFEQAETVTRDMSEQQRARGYRLLCEAYTYWDAFAYREVPDRLRGANNALMLNDWASERIQEKVGFLTKKQDVGVVPTVPTLFHVVDMLENAVREYVRGRWHEAVIKINRYLEMLLEWRLQDAYNFYGEGGVQGKLKSRWSEVVRKYQREVSRKASLDLYKTAEAELRKLRRADERYGRQVMLILGACGDEVAAEVKRCLRSFKNADGKEGLEWLRDIRNRSPYFHGVEMQKKVVRNEELRELFQVAYSFSSSRLLR